MRKKFKMAVISIVLLITGGILLSCGKKTKEEKVKELLSEYVELANEEETTQDPKEIIEQAYSKEFYKRARNGWDEKTNKAYELEDFKISVPEYFELDSQSEKDLQFNEDKAHLSIAITHFKNVELTDDTLKKVYKSCIKQYAECSGPEPVYSSYSKIPDTKVVYYTATIKYEEDDEKTAVVNAAGFVQEDTCLVIVLTAREDSEYDYSDDFINIMTNVK